MKLKRLVACMMAATMALSMAACGGAANNDAGAASGEAVAKDDKAVDEIVLSNEDPVYGGSVTVFNDDFAQDSTLDPAAATSQWRLCYEALFAMDWTYDHNDAGAYRSGYVTMDMVTGQLAKDWSFDSDSAVLTVNLRDDVNFQEGGIYNGRPLVADDVKWSYDRALGLDGAEKAQADMRTDWASQLPMLKGVTVVDDHTVEFQLSSGDELTLNNFIVNAMSLMIAGPEWDELDEAGKADWHNLSGTGPFVITDYQADNYIKWARNENYYGVDEMHPENKLPYIDEVVVMNYASTATQVTQFIAGNLDFMYRTSNNITESELAALKSSDVAYGNYSYSASPVGLAFKMTDVNKPLQDVRVRKALNYAINGQEIWNDYSNNEGDILISGVFSAATDLSAMDQWDEEEYLAYTTQDLDKANALLDEAGYPMDANGKRFSFDVAVFPNLDVDLFYLAADYLAEVGVTMNVNLYNTPPEMEQAGYDANKSDCLFLMLGSTDISMTSMFLANGAPRNAFLVDDDTMDGYLNACLNATSIEELNSNANALDKYFAEQYYQLMLGGCEQQGWYVNDRIKGYYGENYSIKKNIMEQSLARIWTEQ